MQCRTLKAPCNCLHNLSLCFPASQITIQSCTNLDARFEMTTTVDLIRRKMPFLANLSVSCILSFKPEEKSDELSFALSTCSQVAKDAFEEIQS